MLKSPLLFAISILVALLSWTSVAKAAEAAAGASIGLSFALPPAKQTALEKAVKPDADPDVTVSSPKEQAQKEQAQKEDSQSSGASLLSDHLVRVQEPLPPISEIPASENASENTSENNTLENNTENSTGIVTSEGAASGENAKEKNIGVQFLKDDVQMPSGQQNEQAAELPASILPEATNSQSSGKVNSADLAVNLSDRPSSLDDWIFEGGSGSLVAHAVGSAEGTRQWNGERTRAYYGHTDPGNGVWNLGTFSYQHEATSPEDADDKQIKRLKVQGFELEEQATQQGIKLSLPEKLNGLDLANQAPLAALGKGGYIERLAQAHRLKLQGEEAISWARTQAYMDPDTQSWNAPGLGNNIYSISRDQDRRISAIDKALRAYRQTDENSVALANLRGISLEKSKLDKPGFDSLTEAFKLGDRPTHPSNPTSTIPDKATVDTTSSDIGNMEASSEITFTLPSAPKASHAAVANVTPSSQTGSADETVPADEEVLASIVPSSAEPSTVEPTAVEPIKPSAITPSIRPAAEPEPLAFDANEATNASEPESEPAVEHSEVISSKPVKKQAVNQATTNDPTLTSAPATSELFSSGKLPSAIANPLTSSASDKAIPPEDKLNIEAQLDANEATEASMEVAANDARGNRPAPNRSWWRIEDKIVQKK